MTHMINLFDPAVRRDPYPTYATLREAPVQQVGPMGAWAVTRHEDVQYALKHPEIFSSAAFQAVLRPAWLPHNPLADSLLVKDGPDHAKLRLLQSRAFTPKRIALLEPRLTQLAADIADRLLERDEFDFISEFAVAFPAQVIAEVIGLDPALHARFSVWADHMAATSPVEPPADYANAIRQTVKDMERYLNEVIAARRAKPGDDLVSALMEVEADGAMLSDAEILSFLFLLLPAGFETTRHLLANTMLNFLTTDQYEALRADRSAVPGFVEEMLRYDPPVHGVVRIAVQPVELGGVTIPPGSLVTLLIGATGRDPAHVSEPDRFNRTGENPGLLSFGYGPHFCLGAALARLEARVGIETLLDRFAGFKPGSGELSWNIAVTVRGPISLPVRPIRATA
jgi:cytochrome P450